MRIKITMVSGRSFVFENDKYNSLDKWLKGNFKGQGSWFQISKEVEHIIWISNIESIEVLQNGADD